MARKIEIFLLFLMFRITIFPFSKSSISFSLQLELNGNAICCAKIFEARNATSAENKNFFIIVIVAKNAACFNRRNCELLAEFFRLLFFLTRTLNVIIFLNENRAVRFVRGADFATSFVLLAKLKFYKSILILGDKIKVPQKWRGAFIFKVCVANFCIKRTFSLCCECAIKIQS